jgi:glycosyltransferase involved in cell wall biosynthesis
MTRLAQGKKRMKKSIANFLYFRSYVRHAAAIHALTRSEAKQISSLFRTQKIITVANGVEDSLLEASKRLSAADLGGFRREGDLMLGFVGRVDVYHKGLDLLLKAMAALKFSARELRYRLFAIGPFETKKDEQFLYSTVESLELKDNVKFLGPKYGEEKLRYFLACDVFVHTSRFEGMPMAVLEAMALGRPCLVTHGTNVADVVRQGGGWECEPTPESIATSLRAIYGKRDSLKVLGQQSHQLVRTQFTWRKVAEQMSEEYAKIIK